MIKKVLFVCTGNTCRSIMAEAMAKKMFKDSRELKIFSAGTHAPRGMRPPKEVIEVMKGEGIDISSYRAIPLNRKMIEEVDLILVMENEHKREIIQMVPCSERKVFLLGELPGMERVGEIHDPLGYPLEIYRERLKQIKKCLPGVSEYLKRNSHESCSG